MTAEPRALTTDHESHDEEYRYLERRPESWRRQLYIKGRNMTVDHLITGIRANKLSPEEAADDYDLPADAIQEALLYFQRHQDLIDQDWREELAFMESQGLPFEPPAVP